MQWIAYGICHERLEAPNLELVRGWRNADFVRSRMYYQNEISQVEQIAWFETLDSRRDWYFVAQDQDVPFGVFNIKNIDWLTRTGEAGAFVGSLQDIGTSEPALATLALMDFAFFVLGLDFLEAKYHPQFREIARFNEQLGYEVVADEPDGFVRARLSTERYLTIAGPLRKASEKVFKTGSSLINPDEELLEHLAKLEKRYSKYVNFDIIKL
jgi:RimJ/RimL family protein N-acetyltransferase